MKMTPVVQGTGSPAGSYGSERMPSDRISAAKAIAEGKQPQKLSQSDTPVDERIGLQERQMRRLKMRTQVSPDRPVEQILQEVVNNQTADQPQSATADATEQQEPEAVEATKPLSPQLAAIARERRALQAMKREIAEEKAKLAAAQPNMDEYIKKADLISNPLKVFESGLTYDQMTQAILANPGSMSNPEIQELKNEIKALKEGVDKSFQTKEQEAEEAALNQMADEAEAIAASSEDFELIKSEGAYDQVLTKIYDTYKKTGKLLNTIDVMKEVEQKLLENYKKKLELKKIKSLYEAPAPQAQPRTQTQTGMRTLTNRDTAQAPISRRDRAMAAFYRK